MANTYKNYVKNYITHVTTKNCGTIYWTIFEDQTLATVWTLLSEIKSVSFHVCLILWL